MSRILEALEKAHREGLGGGADTKLAERAGVFALPTATRSVSLSKSSLRKAGWVSALPRPPKQSRAYAELADHLRGKLRPPARIVVCGVGQRAGATSASLNLATEMALVGSHTAFWCELPGPSARVRELLGPVCRHGLLDHLYRDTALREVLLRTQVAKLVLVPGRGHGTPRLQRPTVEDLEGFFARLSDRFPDRFVVIDAPPPSESALTPALAGRFEATVLVVAAGTPESRIREAKEALGEVPICCALLNRAPRWFL